MKLSHKNYNHVFSTLFPCILYGGICGTLVGFLVFFFRLLLEKITYYAEIAYGFVYSNPQFIPLLFIVLIFLGFVAANIIKRVPEAAGGGIPYTQGVIRGFLTFKWLRTFICASISTFISFIAGSPVGFEGPCVELGCATAYGTCDTLKTKAVWKRYIATGGAAAGFAAATLTPIAGVLFAVEETHKKFSPLILLVALVSVLCASIVTQALSLAFSIPVLLFNMKTVVAIPLKYIYIPIIIGIACGFVGTLFNFLVSITGSFFDKALKNVPKEIKISAVFVVLGIAGLFLSDNIGGGHRLVEKIADLEIGWKMLLLLFVAKLITVPLFSGSSATGGLFIPMLTIGAITGALMGEIFRALNISDIYYSAFIIIGMGALLSSSMRSPIAAFVFVLEASGSLNNVVFVGIAVTVAFLIGEASKTDSLYDTMLLRMLEKQTAGLTPVILDFEIEIKDNSFAVGKTVRDILWPANCIVKKMTRAGQAKEFGKMSRDGERKIREGDILNIQVQTFDRRQTEREILEIIK